MVGTSVLDAMDAISRVDIPRHVLCVRRMMLTTMTFVAQIDVALDHATVEEIRSSPGPFFVLKLNDGTLASGPRHTVMLRDVRTCSTTQLFRSGRVQISGCGSHVDFALIMDELVKRLGVGRVVSFETHMVNLNFGLGVRVVTSSDMVDALNADLKPLRKNRRAEKRENYAAVTVILPSARPESSIHLQIFGSGNVQVSGRVPADVAIAYRYMMTFLGRHGGFVSALTSRDMTSHRQKDANFWPNVVCSRYIGLMHTHPPCREIVSGCPYCVRYGNFFSSTTPDLDHG